MVRKGRKNKEKTEREKEESMKEGRWLGEGGGQTDERKRREVTKNS